MNHWLQRMAKDDYRGARRVFGWSFYSQGQREHTVSADQFIDAALRFFSDPKPEEGSPWDKGERLAQFVRREPTILALDGVEPLQSSVPGEMARIHDPALDTLLRELSHGMDGLCVLTSRVDFPDLPLSDESGPCRRVNLERLSTEAGRHLLREADVKGLDHELDTAVEEYEGHALALVLLAEYLVKFLGGDIAKRDLIPPFPDKTRAGRHAFRVMEAYDKALEKGGMEAERAILRIIGLFDRPAGKGCLHALRRPPAIGGVTHTIVNLTEREWREAVGTLRSLRLLARTPDRDNGSLDAHPLVREWFGLKLEQETLVGFCQAHGRVYDHRRLTTAKYPGTLEEAVPLFQAVRHGCLANRHHEALNDVYWERLQRNGAQFAMLALGGFGLALGALRGFFVQPWTEPVSAITGRDRAWVANQAGVALTALGRLTEAGAPLEAGFAGDVDAGDWKNASIATSGISALYLASGKLGKALHWAQEGVKCAELQEAAFERYARRGNVAVVLHRVGRLAQALTLFRDSEDRQRLAEGIPILYSYRGAMYAALELDLGQTADVVARARFALECAGLSPVGARWAGLDALNLARALHVLARESASRPAPDDSGLIQEASQRLAEASRLMHASGQQQFTPLVLLASCELHRDFGDRDQAHRDLKEALDLSTRIGLRLHEADARLLEGHMALDLDPPDAKTATDSLKRADTLVQETGYHLRDADLLILEGRLLAKQGNQEAGRAKLEEAIRVAKREEKDGCVYQLAVDQAERYLREMGVEV